MGGTSKSSSSTTSGTTPYGPAQGSIDSIFGNLQGINPNLTGAQSGALDQIENYARTSGNQFQPGITNAANTALGGGQDFSGIIKNAYGNYQNDLAPTARGDYLDPTKNPFFNQTTATIGNDVQNRINAMYAGSGRDPSGAGSYIPNLGRGIAEGTAPVYANAYAQERQNQIGAQNNLFGAGNTATSILSGLDQNRIGNMAQGVGLAQQAQNSAIAPQNAILQAESQRTGLPLSILQQIAGIAGPLGAQFGTTNSNSQGSQTMSGAQQFATIMGGIGSLMPRGPVTGNSIAF